MRSERRLVSTAQHVCEAALRQSFQRYLPISVEDALHFSLGQRPRTTYNSMASALKARFTSAIGQLIIGAMPQSLSNVILHVIFSTKNREPWLDSKIRPRIHAYLATVCRDIGGEAWRVGGVSDHVHVLARLPRTISQAQMIEQIKKTSSKWIKSIDIRCRRFSWQRGYAAVSVSPSQMSAVLEYIDKQQEHHRTRTFQEEYRELLRKHDIEFDERYVWD